MVYGVMLQKGRLITPVLSKVAVSSLQALQAIADSWKDMVLDIGPYKERGHFRLK